MPGRIMIYSPVAMKASMYVAEVDISVIQHLITANMIQCVARHQQLISFHKQITHFSFGFVITQLCYLFSWSEINKYTYLVLYQVAIDIDFKHPMHGEEWKTFLADKLDISVSPQDSESEWVVALYYHNILPQLRLIWRKKH